MNVVKKLLFLLQPRERIQLFLLICAVVLSALIEMVGIASISPFLMVATDPEAIHSNKWLNTAYEFSGAETTTDFFVYLGILSISFICLSNAFIAFTLWAQLRIAGNFSHSISIRLMAHYVTHNYLFFLEHNTAELHKNLISEIDFVSSSIFRPVLRFTSRTIASLAIISLIIIMDPMLALIIGLGLGSAYILVFLSVKRKISSLGKLRATSNSARANSADELLSGIKIIKVLGKEQYFINRFKRAVRDYTRTTAKNGFISEVPRYILEALTLTSVLAVTTFFLGGDGTFVEQVPLMGVYIYAGYRLLPNLQQVYASYVQLGFGHAGLDNLYEAMREVSDEDRFRHKDSTQKITLQDNIELDGITFKYAGAEHPSLKNLSCTISAQATYGIVGKTGAGKSTFIDLLLGLLPNYEGDIRIDGLTLSAGNLKNWQQSIGYVPQSVYLSDTTIASNIAFGIHEKDIDQEKLATAVKIAQADEFIKSLPEGFQTIVGDRGVRLSGGQVQRIGIARALYNNPEILIFDEATSALDKDTEAALVESIRQLQGKKTILLVAHRLETLKYCDKIIRLDKGSLESIETFTTDSAL